MKVLDIICARYDEERHLMHLVKEVEKPDGSTCLNLTMFAPEMLTARAAEYGIDDMDELIDMVVYGGHIEEVAPMSMPAADARNLHRERTLAVKQAITDRKVKSNVDKTAKLRSAGVDQCYIDAAVEEVADVIKRHCTPDPRLLGHARKLMSIKRAAKEAAKDTRGMTKAAARLDIQQQQAAARLQAQKVREQKAAKPTHVTVHLSKKPKAR
jgi:hypothetical protein